MSNIQALEDLIVQGYTFFWLLKFNTGDWEIGELIDRNTVLMIDSEYTYNLDTIKTCPAVGIEKPAICVRP